MTTNQDLLRDTVRFISQVCGFDNSLICASIGYPEVGFADLKISHNQSDLFLFLNDLGVVSKKINPDELFWDHIGTIWFSKLGDYAEFIWDDSMKKYFWKYHVKPEIPSHLKKITSDMELY